MSVQVARRMALAAGAAALVGMGVLTACSDKEKPAETPPPSTTASLSPTEKVITAGRTPGRPPRRGPKPDRLRRRCRPRRLTRPAVVARIRRRVVAGGLATLTAVAALTVADRQQPAGRRPFVDPMRHCCPVRTISVQPTMNAFDSPQRCSTPNSRIS